MRAFAYPFGSPGIDFGDREKMLVRHCGFCFAFTGRDGFVDRDTNRFAVPRISIGRMGHAHFATSIAGALSPLKTGLRLSS